MHSKTTLEQTEQNFAHKSIDLRMTLSIEKDPDIKGFTGSFEEETQGLEYGRRVYRETNSERS